MYILYTCISERTTHWIMKKKVSLYVFYQFNPNKTIWKLSNRWYT